MRRSLTLIFLLFVSVYGLDKWMETTFEDFVDGMYESHIYVTFRADSLDPDTGSVEFVSRFDYNNDGYIDLVVANRPLTPEYVYIYFGGPDGFDPTNYKIYPTGSGANCQGVDFDLDGNTDLVISHYYAPPFDQQHGMVSVHKGTPEGPEMDPWFTLPAAPQTEAVYVCDLNRDGYLDIIDGGSPELSDFTIYWGSSDGYSEERKDTFHPGGEPRHNFEVVDIDKDGYYDIVVVTYTGHNNYIYWGSKDGYSDDDRTPLPYYASQYGHGLSVADLDKDGNIDIIVTGMGPVRKSIIYYMEGRNIKKADTLDTGPCFGGSAVYDFNSDGNLDILFFVGDTSETMNVGKPIIFWGTENGFSTDSITEIGTREYNLSGGFIADFNRDGNVDVFLDQWIKFDNSEVLWGPNFDSSSTLPCNQDHHSVFWEPGNAYTREYAEYYYSSIFDGEDVRNWDGVFWVDDSSDGAYVDVELRTGNTPEVDESWSGWYRVIRGGTVPDSLNSRYIQYRAALRYSNPGRRPTFYSITIFYDPEITIFPDYVDSLYVGMSRDYVLRVWNGGSVSDDIEYSVVSRRKGWFVSLMDSTRTPLSDKDGNGYLNMFSIVPNDTVPMYIRVGVPEDEEKGVVDTIVVYAYSRNNETVIDSALLYIKALKEEQPPDTTVDTFNIVVEPTQYDTIMGGESMLFVFLKNLGSTYDSIRLNLVPTNTRWTYRYYIRGEEVEDGYVVGPLAPRNGLDTLVVVSVPPPDYGSIVGEVDTVLWTSVIVKGQSIGDTTVVSSCTLNIVFLPEVDVHNYPNPFQGITTFIFSIPYDGNVSIRIYNRNGEFIKEITNEFYRAGIHDLTDKRWDGTDSSGKEVSPGVYIYIFRYESDRLSKVIIKKKAMKIGRRG